jgi:deazaflavin-dependent oxidoreductase (nitroreductase family)
LRDISVRRWSAVHVFLYRVTRGMIGRRLVDNDMLLLTTKGHVSGQDRTVPLLHLTDGDSFVVVASYGGRARHPDWYDNLVAHPAAQVQVGSRHLSMRARTASPEERERWWPRILDAYGDYAVYQSRTEREIPVVLLEPVEKG